MADHRLQIILAAKDITGNAFQRIQRSIKGLASSMFSLRGMAVSLGGAAGIGYLVKSSLDAADAIGKTADAVGISTATLQEYQHAAELSGVNTAKLNSVFLAFSKRVGELRQGTGPLVTFLNKFDETLLKNIQSARSTDQALNLVFNRMGRITSATDRAALANAAFSRSGIALTVMVKNGAAGLQEMRKEAQDLGIVMDDKVIRSSEAANDALQKLSATFKSSFTTAITANVDTLTAAIESLAGAMAALGRQASTARRIEELFKMGVVGQSELGAFKRHASLGPKILEEGEARLKSYGVAPLSEHEKRRLGLSGPGAAGPAAAGATAARESQVQLKTNYKTVAVLTDLWATFNDEQTQKASELSIKKAAVLEDMVADNRTAYEAMDSHVTAWQDNFKKHNEVVRDSFDSLTYGLTDGLTSFVTKSKVDFKSLANSIISDLIRIQSRAAISGIFSMIGKAFAPSYAPTHVGAGGTTAFGFHSGGVVGSGAGQPRSVPSALFIGAPRLHGGLAGDEFPAILQKGESVIPKGGRPNVINVFNISTPGFEDFTSWLRGSGAVPLLAAESLNDNGMLRSAMINNL